MANKVIKDPFNAPDSAPQIPAVYQYPKPPDLPSFDDHKGGKTVKRVLTDDAFDHGFVPPEIPDLNFSRKGRK